MKESRDSAILAPPRLIKKGVRKVEAVVFIVATTVCAFLHGSSLSRTALGAQSEALFHCSYRSESAMPCLSSSPAAEMYTMFTQRVGRIGHASRCPVGMPLPLCFSVTHAPAMLASVITFIIPVESSSSTDLAWSAVAYSLQSD